MFAFDINLGKLMQSPICFIFDIFVGSYGKLLGNPGGAPSISSHRYSPYPIPSLNTAAAAAAAGVGSSAAAPAQLGAAGGVQYTVASPLMSQLSAPPSVLPTSAPSQHQQQQQQQHLDAVAAAAAGGVPNHVNQTTQGTIKKKFQEYF